MPGGPREGSIEAPTRHPLDWRSESFWAEADLFAELERVFDICHGCRRCFNLCNAFPTLFDAVDESESGELDGVDRKVYWDVVDHCYLCDMCFMSKCPYVPPHEWNVDFPHLMLRAKSVKFRDQGASFRDRTLTDTKRVGDLAGIPVIAQTVNAINRNGVGRALLEKTVGIHRDAVLPEFHSDPLSKREARRDRPELEARVVGDTTGQVLLFTSCYTDRNRPDQGEDLIAVFEHNGIPIELSGCDACCGMPKLELGDLEAVERYKEINIPLLAAKVDAGYDIITPVPSCTLMFKQELPLMFPEDELVRRVQAATYDPFEYLMLRHREGALRTDFQMALGRISYHVACHLRVQNIGLKTRETLELVPGTVVEPIERCSGHDGTYAVKKEFHEISMKIAQPVVSKVRKAQADHFTSDCPMAADQIHKGLGDGPAPTHPMTLMRRAYGI